MTTKQPAAVRATGRAFPEWARQALASFEPVPAFGATAVNSAGIARQRALVAQVREAWPALCKIVVPEFHRLSDDDLVRQRVFESVLCLLKYCGTNAHYVERRKAQHEADRLAQVIAAKAGELADLLYQRSDLTEREGLVDEIPDLFDSLESWYADAEQNPEYAAWASVADNCFRQFLIIARTQSRPGPGLAELLQVVAERPRFDDRAPQSRKATSDLRRALLGRLDPANLAVLGAPADFRFADAAIADLLTVLFAEATDADDVRKLRVPSG